MRRELPKQYDPKLVEDSIYQMWMENDCFHADPDPDKKPYSIVMPPPNVTGRLHMGHAMDSTLQDILTRHRSRGHRHADQGRRGASNQRKSDTLRPWPREIP